MQATRPAVSHRELGEARLLQQLEEGRDSKSHLHCGVTFLENWEKGLTGSLNHRCQHPEGLGQI